MITSLQNEIVKYLFKLKEKKYRSEFHEFLVEGEHLVREAIQAGCLKTVFTSMEGSQYPVETVEVSVEVMSKISDVTNPPGVVGLCRMEAFPGLSRNILVLDGIQDPGNLGTLIRSAVAFGFTSIVSENSVDMYNPKVVRATQGGIFKITWIEQNVEIFMKSHPEYFFVGTDVAEGTPLRGFPVPKRNIAIILGNEANGIRRELLEEADARITIEMKDTESLNVGVAGSILMYHLGT